jgi:LDH2 family malate/lactate/ureidoglycolate dehydrogenase
MAEVLAGVLTGADFGERMVDHDVNEIRNVGHLFIAIDIECFMPLQEYKQRIGELVQSIKQAPVIPGHKVYLPGEIEWEKKKNQTNGLVAIPAKTVEEFLKLCEENDIPRPKAH